MISIRNDLLNGLSLFSGIGGIDVALSEYVRPIAYCEIEPYCQSVLLSRMQEGDLPKAPIWDDIRTLSKGVIGEPVDIIVGGFP
jgi:site-specific DNA-cytosine methylase